MTTNRRPALTKAVVYSLHSVALLLGRRIGQAVSHAEEWDTTVTDGDKNEDRALVYLEAIVDWWLREHNTEISAIRPDNRRYKIEIPSTPWKQP